MYSFQSRVRYSETDTDAKLSLTGIMNYLQDCSTFQSESLGIGLDYMERSRKAWLLSSWQIVIGRRPKLGEEITVATWPYDFKGIYGMRNFVILDKDGNYLVRANSCWFMIDMETGKPMRVPPEDRIPYGTGENPLEMDYAPRKIALPQDMTAAGRTRVMKHQIDTNHHVNNAQYIEMARDVLPEEIEIGEIRAEYKKAARLGDEVDLRLARTGDGYIVSLRDTEGTVFANVELKRMKTGEDGRHVEDRNG